MRRTVIFKAFMIIGIVLMAIMGTFCLMIALEGGMAAFFALFVVLSLTFPFYLLAIFFFKNLDEMNMSGVQMGQRISNLEYELRKIKMQQRTNNQDYNKM